MPKKSMDISLVEEEKSDLTFFNIEEEDEHETLKALKQSYVTTNYKDETILNLQNELKSNSEEVSKEIKLKSYNDYNNSLELANRGYITKAVELIESALEINPKDVDILNLRGLLKLLKCDFSKAFESFYTALCYGNNELSRKYVDILSSEDFKVFLGRYNHSIRFINEELNQESIHILDNIIDEDPDLIEPYVILYLLYNKLGNEKKKDYYFSKLKEVDKDNPIFENDNEESLITEKVEENTVQEKSKKSNKKNIIPYVIIAFLAVGVGIYHINNKAKIESLTSELSSKEEKLNETDKQLSETNEQLNETNKKLDETTQVLDEAQVQNEIASLDEDTLYTKATSLKKSGNYEDAIEYFKGVVKYGKSKKFISASIYEVALLNEKLGNDEEAIIYYRKYIYTYTPEENYYDDAYYQLGMLYYDNGELDKAKEIFYGLRSEVPNSMYNNSKVSEILKEK
ncbi:tetratricopeptide repeat protein [Romboutsia sp. Marseille-P6047]|nr:tetratricopeptide repeat protein [Romboutsia sp. Marseille-P6047]